MKPSAEADLPEFLWIDDEPGDDELQVESCEARLAVDSRRRTPGEGGLWIFLLGDMSLFGFFFLTFLSYNRTHRKEFAAAADGLLRPLGATNTLVLLISSYCVVLAVRALAAGTPNRARPLVLGAMACAAAFVVLKAVEWTHEVSAGHTPGENLFYLFYFVMTGVHLLHVLVGGVLLEYLRRRTHTQDAWELSRVGIEAAAVYWHMVDLLWIVIFTLLYLVCVG